MESEAQLDEQHRAYEEYVEALSRDTTLGLPGYYVPGALSQYEAEMVEPIYDLFREPDGRSESEATVEAKVRNEDNLILRVLGRQAVKGL